jgi:ACS family tartrate transporter-like MFS transporter
MGSAPALFSTVPNVIARFLLGMAEAGFFPGIAFFMTCWFPSRRRGRAMGVFFAVEASAGILVGPVSANLLRLDALFGIAGWQWVFLAEGLPTLALASLCLLVLRDSPADAEWLTSSEREWLEKKLQAERDAAIGRHLRTGRAIKSPQLLTLTGIALLTGFGVYGKGFFLPVMLKTFGFSNVAVGYLNTVPAIAGVVGSPVLAKLRPHR